MREVRANMRTFVQECGTHSEEGMDGGRHKVVVVDSARVDQIRSGDGGERKAEPPLSWADVSLQSLR